MKIGIDKIIVSVYILIINETRRQTMTARELKSRAMAPGKGLTAGTAAVLNGKRKGREEWERANGYERHDFALCLHCAFFAIDGNLPIHGECRLRALEGVRGGVLTDSVCNLFVSRQGTDIDGEALPLRVLSALFDVEVMGDGSLYIPRVAGQRLAARKA